MNPEPVFYQRPLGVLQISGATRLDLIDRMSTQQVGNLRPGQGAATVFTTEIGRMIDRVLIFADDDTVTAVTGENYSDQIGRYLMSYVFFNDDFQLVDRTAETAVLGVYGAAVRDLLGRLGITIDVDLPRHHWQKGVVAGHDISIHRTDPIGGDGYLLLTQTAHVDLLKTALLEAHAREIDEGEFEALRIAAGLPRLGHELTQDYIPLEAGLWDDVSFNKGCYIGQEIIARMESRGKLAKRLVALESSQSLTAGSEIQANGKTVGSITSAAGEIGLGYVKTAALDGDLELSTNNASLTVHQKS
ncbi:MAG: hypothetical protein QNJ45_29585 [Ardenticatenaceae bacterium]|nr:hypothetical protein [Ardenticatenaceae bacterium]